MRKVFLIMLMVFLSWGCAKTSQESSDENNQDITQVNWEIVDSSGNATVAPPWSVATLSVQSNGKIVHTTEVHGGNNDENGTTTDWSAQIEASELSALTALIKEANVKSQPDVDASEGCVGGGYESITYKENGTKINSFTIISGCGASVKDDYPKLDELLKKLISLEEKFKSKP